MMDNIPPDVEAAQGRARPRLAYTLNNTQPVRCTYISEEPLFYLDNQVQIEEDEDFPDDLLMDFAEAAFPDDPLFPTDADAAALFLTQFGEATPRLNLDQVMTDLRASRMGATLLDFALGQGITIALADQIEDAIYDRMAGTLTLRPHQNAVAAALVLTRELRRVWQHRQGALIHPLLFHPDHAIIVNRVLAADLMTMVVRVAWETKLAGDESMWQYLDQNGHADLTRAMKREALADFRALSNGRAGAAVFEAWFLSERCRPHDRKLIQNMLSDYQGYVFKAGHEDTSKMLTQQVIAALGAQPFGKNYLTPHAGTILSDPIFTDIRDRSSANFLWFIKFEQSFRQSERDLQHRNEKSTNPMSHEPQAAQIIPYPELSAAPSKRSAGQGVGSATIIDLSTHLPTNL